mgnify:FL=1|jgi:hypothetical protein|tara:strand:+ start:289 stop:531 length:243 start_codon:yes stop_codon:yes gene_type:complete
MFVKHLQDYLEKFTEGPGGKRGNAVSDARIYIMDEKGFLEEIKRIEVHESTIIGDNSIKVVLKPQREKKLILNPGLVDDH